MNRLCLSAVVLVPSIVVATLAAAAAPPEAAALSLPPERPNRPVCPGPIAHGAAGCYSRVITNRKGTPLAESIPGGYGPADFHGAYNLPTTSASPQTIAIVDAFDDPTIASDLAHYSETYGLPACTTANGCFSKVNQSGQEGPYPKKDAGWSLEISLDVETAHAICQNCEILLVEADSNQFSDLTTALATAVSLGATEISNSYGGSEYSGETSDSSYNHPGIAITASAGDNGYGAEYPAASPYVIAVGGTTLTLGSSHSYGSEKVWSGTGSGCSAYASAQSWQTSDANWSQTACGSKRGIADVAADADPNTGASVYDTTKYQGEEGWFTVGGTSLSAPLIAAVYALAGGGSTSYPASNPYGHQTDSPASLHDVTSGSNGSCNTIMCKGAAGYDGPTGVGTPNGITAFGEPGADLTPPQTTITAGPTGPTNDATPSFSFSSAEPGSSFECRLDSGSFGACSSPYTAPTLTDGPHGFEVRATDEAGNTDPSPAKREFTVDTTAPQTTITAGPTGPTNDATPSFSFSSAEPGSSFECRLDSGSFGACSSPYTAPTLTDGPHGFEVRATDEAGNTDPSPAKREFTVDTTAPQTTITAGPTGPTNDATPSFSFSSAEPGSSFECRLDSGSFGACSSPYTAPTLTDGPHGFEVRATDEAGNTDPSPAKREFTVDTTAPQTTITAGPTGPTNDATPSFSFSSAEPGSSFECRLDSGSFGACSSPYTAPTLTDGPHSFEVRATDEAGNTDPSPAKREFTVDTTAPQTTITAGPTGPTNDATPSFSFSSAEPGSSFECRLDSGSFGGCSSPYTAPTLTDGPHGFEVRATDEAGNTDPSPAKREFTVDTTAPQTTITAGPTGPTNDATPSFSFSSAEPGSSFECRLDSGSFGACSSPYTAPTLTDGPHGFEVRATDEAGNTDPSPAKREFTVETTAPASQASSPAATNSTTITVSYTASDAGSGLATVELWAKPPGSPSYAKVATDTSPEASGSFSYRAEAGDGSYAFYTRATDKAGNYEAAPGSADSTTKLETIAPQTTIASGPSGPAMQVAPQAMAPAPSIAVAARHVRVFGDKALVLLRCQGAGPCRGVVKLIYWRQVRRVVHRHGHRKMVRRTEKILIGMLGFIVSRKKAITIEFNGRGRSLLDSAHGHRLTVLLLGRGVKHRAVVLLQPARHKHKR